MERRFRFFPLKKKRVELEESKNFGCGFGFKEEKERRISFGFKTF